MDSVELSAFISVDVEASGPTPGLYSLLAIGACSVEDPSQTFYAEIKPQTDRADPQAMAVHGLDLTTLAQNGLELPEAMTRFAAWVGDQVPAGRSPVFVSYNAPFDWMFVHDAFHRTLGRNPFGHFPLDIRAYYMGLSGKIWSSIRLEDLADRYLEGRRLTHNARDDALVQGELFRTLRDLSQSPAAGSPPGFGSARDNPPEVDYAP